ncbi:MAG: ChaN family lipoprotein [Bdellovibrionales bacterium]|nr:ChaN family lipoprotein [Bdellovibrionales bacterium]
MIKLLCVTAIAVLSQVLFAAEVYQASNKGLSTYEELVSSLEPGSVLVLGEIHDHEGHHNSHKRILEEMVAQGVSFHVGMEFFYYPSQSIVDQYLYNEINENDFLEQVGWGGFSFDFYRDKTLLPLETGGHTFAINAPRELTRFVARNGLEKLTPELQQLMPPNFELGDEHYYERFRQAVGGDHVPPEFLGKYFAAQSIWDETMAWQSLKAIDNSREQDVFVIIVGDFHVAFGGGLPDSLIARGASKVVTVSHADSSNMKEGDKLNWLEPHPEWGQRADWVVFADREESNLTRLACDLAQVNQE